MLSRRLLVLALLLASFTTCLVAQQTPQEKLFAISVAPPTSPKNVQVRYFLTGEFGVVSSASTATDDKGTIVIRTEVESKSATSFRAIAYAPGCQFVVITVDDLSTSNRQGQFECQPLRTTLLQGSVPTSGHTGQDLQVEVLYSCDWAPEFFKIGHGAISPLSLAKVQVATDGSFSVELPDFAGDPLYSTLSSNATLKFFLVDASNGQRLSSLKAPADLSDGGALKIASSYPHVAFAVGK
ncbi:MAG TPA: hypothetical protein VI685_13015 [Candidatus Angelobacter sp.]